MNSVDLAFTSAVEQANLIRTGQVSPSELVNLYLERIQQFNPKLGSYYYVAAEEARAEAKAKTEQLSQIPPEERPPFFGVPISVKDLNPVTGLPCTYGTIALKDNRATYDDGIVTHIKEAGFIILGKTATSELGSLPYTETQAFPPARNPWNPDYTAGGSSGGAAAAVAAGLCPVAQGSDGGGSIRGPAFCCGVVGIKPSRGRVTHAPAGDSLSGLGIDGPIGRTVADAAALLDVLSGYMTGDPYWLPEPTPSFLETALHPQVPRLRIAYSTTLPIAGEAHPLCQQPVQAMVEFLESQGHILEVGCPDFADLLDPFVQVWQSGVAASGIPAEYLEPINRWLMSRCGSAGAYLQAVGAMQRIARRIVAFFDRYDVLLLPTYMSPTIRVGEWAELSPEAAFHNIIHWVAPCPAFNASGQPAIALPVGFTPEGLPLGIQLVGRPAAEATLIALAAQIEAAHPWSQHRPILN